MLSVKLCRVRSNGENSLKWDFHCLIADGNWMKLMLKISTLSVWVCLQSVPTPFNQLNLFGLVSLYFIACPNNKLGLFRLYGLRICIHQKLLKRIIMKFYNKILYNPCDSRLYLRQWMQNGVYTLSIWNKVE